MFQIILFSVFAVIMFVYLLLKQITRKNWNKFHKITMRFLKVFVIIYSIVSFLMLFLPDAFALNYSAEMLTLTRQSRLFALLRWFSALSFVALPIAVFYKNRTIRNIAVYFCLVITIINTFYLPTYLEYATSIIGRGLNSIEFMPSNIKEFLINETFRETLFGVIWGMELLIICLLGVEEKHVFNIKSVSEYFKMFFGLIFGLLAVIPIYVPQRLCDKVI